MSPGMELVVPDPRSDLVPAGWWDDYARPLIMAAEWGQLNEWEGRLQAVADYIDALSGEPSFEMRCALRCVEARRGQLLIETRPHGGDRKSEDAGSSRHAWRLDPDELPSESTMTRWRNLAEHWDDVVYPHLTKQAADGQVPGEATQGACLRLVKAERSVVEAAPLAALGQFQVLYADPPWRYEHVVSRSRAVEKNYPTMALDEIKALDVPATDDAVLFLWATSPKLAEAMDVIDAWGFEYRTSLVWVKGESAEDPTIGMGYYVRQAHELLLVAKRGELPVPAPETRPASVFVAPRRAHSAKPEVVYDLIECMYPRNSKVELFARTRRDGWEAWGNDRGSK